MTYTTETGDADHLCILNISSYSIHLKLTVTSFVITKHYDHMFYCYARFSSKIFICPKDSMMALSKLPCLKYGVKMASNTHNAPQTHWKPQCKHRVPTVLTWSCVAWALSPLASCGRYLPETDQHLTPAVTSVSPEHWERDACCCWRIHSAVENGRMSPESRAYNNDWFNLT